jgi:hypothetical protein
MLSSTTAAAPRLPIQRMIEQALRKGSEQSKRKRPNRLRRKGLNQSRSAVPTQAMSFARALRTSLLPWSA